MRHHHQRSKRQFEAELSLRRLFRGRDHAPLRHSLPGSTTLTCHTIDRNHERNQSKLSRFNPFNAGIQPTMDRRRIIISKASCLASERGHRIVFSFNVNRAFKVFYEQKAYTELSTFWTVATCFCLRNHPMDDKFIHFSRGFVQGMIKAVWQCK